MRTQATLLVLAAAFSLLPASASGQVADDAITQFETLEDAMAQPGLSRTQRFAAGDKWCHGPAYPGELTCSQQLAALAEGELETTWDQSVLIADVADSYLRDECTREDSTTGCNIPALMDLLTLSQEAWRDYAAAQCEAEAHRGRGGWGGTADRNFCSARLAAVRADEIEDMMRFYRAQFGPELDLGEETQ
ncbi:hypothetical protein GCM10009127_13860 [Alteraurantiacibacter aestuarii]|uniref:DUF1311 domain-containing protein n=1 Tax=Alteraurantiacibacter aestuarii TaxID=650004 RepID=A0A844ZKD5_9SPHN|nr:lysozyme inhibitor LprI family protein [Alteraurantiacibacter aestuarii]MXO88024.1 hypothetical protein [Alteraurantiacibacter aestuarii]